MEEEINFPKMMPKGEVLCKAAQRYPDLPMEAMEVFLRIKQVAHASVCDNQEALEPYGLSEGKFYVLVDLFSEDLMGHDEPSPSEIAEHLGVTRATITGLLDGLERDGYLARCPDKRDRRALTVHLTDKARSFLDEFIPRSFHRIGTSMAKLNEAEMQTLLALLAKIGPLSSETDVRCNF